MNLLTDLHYNMMRFSVTLIVKKFLTNETFVNPDYSIKGY